MGCSCNTTDAGGGEDGCDCCQRACSRDAADEGGGEDCHERPCRAWVCGCNVPDGGGGEDYCKCCSRACSCAVPDKCTGEDHYGCSRCLSLFDLAEATGGQGESREGC